MGVLSRSVSFFRYLVRGQTPTDFLSWVDERLQRHVFLTIDDTPEESSCGWVALGNVLESEFVPGQAHKGEYLAFSLRCDTRKVPGALFRKHYLMAEANLRRQQKGRYLGRQQKAELKKAVMAELLKRQMPQPALYDVVWHPGRERLWLFATSPRVREVFETLFRETFEMDLYLIIPYTLAQQVGGPTVELDTLTPAVLTPAGRILP